LEHTDSEKFGEVVFHPAGFHLYVMQPLVIRNQTLYLIEHLLDLHAGISAGGLSRVGDGEIVIIEDEMSQRGIIQNVPGQVREALEGQMCGREVQNIQCGLAMQALTQEVAHLIPEVVVR
jgi:hypothetical protein